MLDAFLRKLGQVLFLLLATGFVSFALFSYAVDPVNALVTEATSLEEREALREKLGFNRSFIVQFGDFLGRILRGDFGVSLRSNEPIVDLLAARLPATLELVLVSALFTLFAGIVLGMYTGTNWRSRMSNFILTTSLLGVSFPTFLLGLLFVFLFSVHLGWLPAAGRGGVVDLGWWKTSFLTIDGWRSLLLPALTLSIFNIGLFIRLVRAEVLEIRTMDYVKFARARGIDERAINRRHVFPNALTPLVNVGALTIGTMVAFSMITESVFNWPGMGLLFVQSVNFADFPVMAIFFLFVALMFVLLSLLADILMVIIDPRLRRKTS